MQGTKVLCKHAQAVSALRRLHTSSRLLNSHIQSQSHTQTSISFVSKDALKDEKEQQEVPSIREIFDKEDVWKSFNHGNGLGNSELSAMRIFGFSPASNSAGLFANPYLKNPKGLKEFASESLDKLKSLVDHMIEDDSEEGLLRFIRNLDRLSDILCRVIDLLEFVRVVHPSRNFVDAAQESHLMLFQYMNVLNTSSKLYLKLDHVLNNEKIRSQLSEEELSVGNLLLTDFLRSGINMDDETKNNFVELSQHISLVGQHFINGVGNSDRDHILIKTDELTKNDLDESILSLLSTNLLEKSYKIPLYGKIPFEILRSCSNREVRRKIWKHLHQAPEEQIQLLDLFLKQRGVLAHLLGYGSYGEYQLQDKMAKSPKNVMSFLLNILKRISSGVNVELKELLKNDKSLKHLESDELIAKIRPWDRDYLTSLYFTNKRRPQENVQDISNYFSVGTVIQGLSDLFQRIYGIKLVPMKSEPGETWCPEVRKFNVVSEQEGPVGIMYLDLFYRLNKTLNPAHFTVCCSRKIYPEELHPDDKFKLKYDTIHTSSGASDLFQLPVISLVCNFQPDPVSGITLLSFNQLETLFHEMGHAMHSMLGRTNLHNVSGTRCPTDFVELPSILMEHFARDHRVLQMIGKHYKTGETLPLQLLNNNQIDNNFLKNCETLGQIKMLLLDQLLHSNAVFDREFDLVQIYHDLEKQLRVFEDSETNWPGKFGHLFSYGSVYYSYLLDRAIASNVWFHLFEKDPLNRANGEKFRNGILKWGGSRNPWELLADVLDEPALAKGDSRAMEIIGDVKDI